jgi:hypothetical protein
LAMGHRGLRQCKQSFSRTIEGQHVSICIQ